jgi:hypothetical protein
MDVASTVILKLSPMLDWHKAVADIEKAADSTSNGSAEARTCHVAEVHCVATEGECKELLLVVRQGRQEHPLHVVCVEGERVFVSHANAGGTVANAGGTEANAGGTEANAGGTEANVGGTVANVGGTVMAAEDMILLVPGAATMKAGCFRELEEAFGVRQMAANSHLFLAPGLAEDFQKASTIFEKWPGRVFRIQAVTGLSKREIAPLGVYRANVAVRNFPMTADELRHRLKLKDGGEVYLFATTLNVKKRVLLWCSRLKERDFLFF